MCRKTSPCYQGKLNDQCLSVHKNGKLIMWEYGFATMITFMYYKLTFCNFLFCLQDDLKSPNIHQNIQMASSVLLFFTVQWSSNA